jgi:hypothetical protein
VHRLLGEQRQDGGADVAAVRPTSEGAAAAAPGVTSPRPPAAGATAGATPSAKSPSGPVRRPAPAVGSAGIGQVFVVVVVFESSVHVHLTSRSMTDRLSIGSDIS